MNEGQNSIEKNRRESMDKPRQVTPTEFVVLIADKKPAEAFYQTVISSFDWQTWTIFFYDGDTKIHTSFESSAHATPDIPQALMDMMKRAESSDDPRALRRILRPYEVGGIGA